MRAYSSMSTTEFVQQLRDIAINARARPAVIDQIDAIVAGPDDDEIEEIKSAAYDEGYSEGQQAQFEDMLQSLFNVLEDLGIDAVNANAITEAMQKEKL